MQERIRIQAALSLTEKTFDFSPLYSGGCLWVDGFDGAVVLDLDGLEFLPERIPCCLRHNENAIVGTMKPERREVHGIPQIYAHGNFENTLSARQVLTAFKADGVHWEGSISTGRFCRMNDMDKIPSGQTVRVNNQTFYGPVNVVRKWSVEEGSFVEKGGDVRNFAQIHAQALTMKGKDMSEELRQFIVDCDSDPDSLTADQLAIYEKAFVRVCSLVAAEADEDGEGETNGEGENTDGVGTDDSGSASPEPIDGTKAEGEEVVVDADDLEESPAPCGETDEESPKTDPVVAKSGRCNAKVKAKTRVKAQRCGNPISSYFPAGQVRASAGAPSRMNVYAVAMMRNLGTFTDAQVKAAGFSDDAMTEGLAKQFNGWSFRDIACEMFRHATGRVYRGTEDAFISGFFHPDRVQAAGFSTQNPLGILENVLNKAYYEGSLRIPSVVSKLAKKILLDNLQDAKITSYDIYGLPPDMGEDAALKHATLVGEDYDVSIGRSGNILTLTRDMVLKNEVESFINATLKLGMKHQRKREKRGIQKLLAGIGSGLSLSSANGNSITAKLTLSGLDSAAAALQSMTVLGSDPSDPEFTEFSGKYLLLPPSLAATAQGLFQATNLVSSGAGGTIALTNTYHRYEPLISSYLGTSAGAGGSDSGWFLFADPEEAALLAETRLRGAEEPHITPVDVKDGVIGASWATFFEYGFGLMDHRAAVYSAGTAT